MNHEAPAYRFSFSFSLVSSADASEFVVVDVAMDAGNCNFLRFLGFLVDLTVSPHWIDILVFVLMRVFVKNQASATQSVIKFN